MNEVRLRCPFCSHRAPVNTVVLSDLGRRASDDRWAHLDVTCAKCQRQYGLTMDCRSGEVFVQFIPGKAIPRFKRHR